MVSLKNKKMFMLDMDGTIYNENVLIPGALDFFNALNRRHIYYSFMTNNSSKSKYDYVKKLLSLGITCTTDNIISSVNATVDFLKNNKPAAKIYLVGTDSFKSELLSEGFRVVESSCRELDVDYVLVGFDTELNYQKIRSACYYLDRGVCFIATNCDLKCPVSYGEFIPDCGAICKLLETATGKEPVFLGKPNSYMIDFAMKKWNLKKSDIVTVGDRLYTDVAIGVNIGVDSIAVLTGETTRNEIAHSPIKPTYIYDSINDLYNDIK